MRDLQMKGICEVEGRASINLHLEYNGIVSKHSEQRFLCTCVLLGEIVRVRSGTP